MRLLPFREYDKIILAFSGGKDSIAAFLALVESGVNLNKLELWHQAVDGRHEHHIPFFDWASTESYIEAFAEHFNVGLHYQWRAGGLFAEMHRKDARTADVYYEGPDGIVHHLPTTTGKFSTRLMFPAKSANLMVRWCSAYGKIMVSQRALANRPDLQGTKTAPAKILFISGERREESTNRAGYAEFEPHRSNCLTRIVHHYRPVIDWTEARVWAKMEQYGIQAHPCYHLGFPRKSCKRCIFLSADHWATLQEIEPRAITEVEQVEQNFGSTLDNKKTIRETVARGRSLFRPEMEFYRLQSENFTMPIVTKSWQLPAGAYGSGGGAI